VFATRRKLPANADSRKWPLFEKSGAKTFITLGPVAAKPARPRLTKFFAAFCSQKVAFLS
jgi:hypothetical protein